MCVDLWILSQPPQVTYEVSDSAGLTAKVQRTVLVQPRCPMGDRVCLSGTECSVNGVCLEDLASSATGQSGSTSPPLLRLNGPRYASVRQYSPYLACSNVSRLGTVEGELPCMADTLITAFTCLECP